MFYETSAIPMSAFDSTFFHYNFFTFNGYVEERVKQFRIGSNSCQLIDPLHMKHVETESSKAPNPFITWQTSTRPFIERNPLSLSGSRTCVVVSHMRIGITRLGEEGVCAIGRVVGLIHLALAGLHTTCCTRSGAIHSHTVIQCGALLSMVRLRCLFCN